MLFLCSQLRAQDRQDGKEAACECNCKHASCVIPADVRPTFTALEVFCMMALTRETDLAPAFTTVLLMLVC